MLVCVCVWLHGGAGNDSAQLKVLRQVATSVGLDMMLSVVSKTGDAVKSMTNFERLHEAAWYAPCLNICAVDACAGAR